MEEQIYTQEQMDAVLAQLEVNRLGPCDWGFEFHARPFTAGGTQVGWLVWVSFNRYDITNGQYGRGRGRDMIVWAGTSKSGVVKTMWVQVKLVVEHELMHAFHYRDRELFDAHASVDALHSISGMAETDAYNQWKPEPTNPMMAAVVATGEIA